MAQRFKLLLAGACTIFLSCGLPPAYAAVPNDATIACVRGVLNALPEKLTVSTDGQMILDYGDRKYVSKIVWYGFKDTKSGIQKRMMLTLEVGGSNGESAMALYPPTPWKAGQTLDMMDRESPENPLRAAFAPLWDKCKVFYWGRVQK